MDVDLACYTLCALYTALAVVGVLGNAWVLLTVSAQLFAQARKPNQHSSACVYLLLLSVADLVSFVPVPMLVTDLIENRFPFGLVFCKLLYACEAANKSLSPLVLTALSLDRYVAVCRPRLLWLRQTAFALLVSFVCCVGSLAFIVPVTVAAEVMHMSDNAGHLIEKCSVYNNPQFDLLQALACYVLPLVVILSVYTAILWKLFRHTRNSQAGRKTSISLARVVKCSVMVVAFYFICWTPYWIMRMGAIATMSEEEYAGPPPASADTPSIVNATEAVDEPPQAIQMDGWSIMFMYLLHSLPYAQSAFNWLFYAFLNRNMRQNGGRRSQNTTLLENQSSGWRQHLAAVGSQLRAAGQDTSQLIMKRSPFRTRSKVQNRSECAARAPSSHSQLCSSLIEEPSRDAPLSPKPLSESSSVEWL